MGLINLQTNLKSLKFGKDRPGGGNSGQPFIQTPIPDSPSSNIGLGTDALIRGGILAPQRALKDVERLSRYLFNPKSPSGLLFTLKENLLSRTSVKTEASKGLAYGGGAVNAGIYTPLSTLAQAGVAGLGGHLNQKGIDPTGLIQPLSIKKYEKIVKDSNGVENNNLKLKKGDTITLPGLSSPIKIPDYLEGDVENRLLKLYKDKQFKFSLITQPLLEYGGGPGSILGIGKTRINFASERTGINNKELKGFYNNGFNTFKNPREGEKSFNTLNLLKGITQKTIYNLPNQQDDINIGEEEKNILKFDNSSTDGFSLYKESKHSKGLTPSSPKKPNLNFDNQPNGDDTYLVAINQKYKKDENLLGKTIETRLNLGDPGAQEGKFPTTKLPKKGDLLDKINGSPIYQSDGKKGERHGDYNDLVAFRIGVIDPNSPNGDVTYMNFRSYIDSFSDSYSSNWKSQTYMGRGEKFYKYQDFDRSISMAFTVAAQSQGEMNGMYQKLNFLASSLAPTYTPLGYMAGNLVKMTVGNYIYEQVGFISSLTYDIPQDSSWEISLNPTGEISRGRNKDNNPDELPFMIKVTGLRFTPIHNFRPEPQLKPPPPGSANRFITDNLPFPEEIQKNPNKKFTIK
jgi:hypothetical protein